MEILAKLWIRYYLFIKVLYKKKRIWKLLKLKRTQKYIDASNGILLFNIVTLILIIFYLFSFLYGPYNYHSNSSLRFSMPLIFTIILFPIFMKLDGYKLKSKTAFYRIAIKSSQKYRKWHAIVYIILTILILFIAVFVLGTRLNFK